MFSISSCLHQIGNLSCDINDKSYARPNHLIEQPTHSRISAGTLHAKSKAQADKSDTLLLFVMQLCGSLQIEYW